MNPLLNQKLLVVLLTLSAATFISTNSAHASEGQEVYQRCVACHQPDGAGIPGIFPPLKNRLAGILASDEGREYVTMVLVDGLIGTIKINGQRYVGAMPAQDLSNAQIAAVLNYVATEFGTLDAANSDLHLSEDEVAGIRSKYSGANAQPTLSLRSKVPALAPH